MAKEIVKQQQKTPLAEAVGKYMAACRGYDMLKNHSVKNLTAEQVKKRSDELKKTLALKRQTFGAMTALNGGRVPQIMEATE